MPSNWQSVLELGSATANAGDAAALPSSPARETRVSVLAQHAFSVVLWDWDGVLVDSRRNFYEAYEKVLREEGIAATSREIFLREGEPTPVLLRAILDSHSIRVDDNRIHELVTRRREYDFALGGRQLFPAVPSLLHRLRHAGCRNGLVTGSSRNSLCRQLPPEQQAWFDTIVTADDVKCGKPDPEPFLCAMRTLQTAPQACLVVENAPFGIASARAAGCAVVAIATTLATEDLSHANWIVGNHDELELLLFGDLRHDAHPGDSQ